MVANADTVQASFVVLEEARGQLRLGNHREAARLFWEASTQAIEETAARVGYQLLERRQYADVSEMLEPWYQREYTFGFYCSMLMLKNTAAEDYQLGDVWMHELSDDIHELIGMLQDAQ